MIHQQLLSTVSVNSAFHVSLSNTFVTHYICLIFLQPLYWQFSCASHQFFRFFTDVAGLHCLMSTLGAARRLLALRVNNNCFLICVYNKYSKVDAQCNDCENIVTVDDVLNGINHVKSNKCDGYGLVYADHFIYAPHKLLVFLSLLFTSMVYHGYTPDGFYVATIQPIQQEEISK